MHQTANNTCICSRNDERVLFVEKNPILQDKFLVIKLSINLESFISFHDYRSN